MDKEYCELKKCECFFIQDGEPMCKEEDDFVSEIDSCPLVIDFEETCYGLLNCLNDLIYQAEKGEMEWEEVYESIKANFN